MNSRSRAKWISVAFVGLLGAATLWSASSMADDPATPPPWTAPSRAARKKNPIAADATSIATGKAVFIAQCIKCHGNAGKGDGPSAKDINPKPRDLSDPTVASETDGSLYWKITSGRPPMPTFDNPILSDDARWNVVNYLRTLQPTAAKQPEK